MQLKLQALRLEGADRLAAVSRSTTRHVSDRLNQLDDMPRYEHVRARAAQLEQRARPTVAAARQAWLQTREKIGDTDVGTAVGRATRGAQRSVRSLPLLSSVADVVATRNGLDL